MNVCVRVNPINHAASRNMCVDVLHEIDFKKYYHKNLILKCNATQRIARRAFGEEIHICMYECTK